MTEFSSDREPRNAPVPHSAPGPGQIGVAQARRALSPGSGGPRNRHDARPPAKPSIRPSAPSQGRGLGLPSRTPTPPAQQPPSDLRHLVVLAEHRNAVDLGRDTPFSVWMQQNGRVLEGGLMKPGQHVWDMYEDM